MSEDLTRAGETAKARIKKAKTKKKPLPIEGGPANMTVMPDDYTCDSCMEKELRIIRLESRIRYIKGAIEFVMATPLPGKALKNLRRLVDKC